MTKKQIASLVTLATIVAGAATIALSQQTAPNEFPGCVYTTADPTLADRQSTAIRCDVNGKLLIQ